MRDINVTKYRKLLQQLQYFCSLGKAKDLCEHSDFERGFAIGRRAAYNEVLRKLSQAIDYADLDWEHTHCREETCDY
jgi:hypothetical protein